VDTVDRLVVTVAVTATIPHIPQASGEEALLLKHQFCQADSPRFLLVLTPVTDMEEPNINHSRVSPYPLAWSLPVS